MLDKKTEQAPYIVSWHGRNCSNLACAKFLRENQTSGAGQGVATLVELPSLIKTLFSCKLPNDLVRKMRRSCIGTWVTPISTPSVRNGRYKKSAGR